MLGRVLRPASAVRPTGELAAFLVNGSSFKSNSTDTSDNKRLVRSRSIFAQRARGRALLFRVCLQGTRESPRPAQPKLGRPAFVRIGDGVAPAQQSESFDVVGRARI